MSSYCVISLLFVILLANVLEDGRFVVQSSKLLPTGARFDEVADWFLVLYAPPFFDETLRHFPSRLDVLQHVVGTPLRLLQIAVFCTFQLPVCRHDKHLIHEHDSSSNNRMDA